jgi:hypothetical protein
MPRHRLNEPRQPPLNHAIQLAAVTQIGHDHGDRGTCLMDVSPQSAVSDSDR